MAVEHAVAYCYISADEGRQGGEEEAASVSHTQALPFSPSSTHVQKTPLLAGDEIVQNKAGGILYSSLKGDLVLEVTIFSS